MGESAYPLCSFLKSLVYFDEGRTVEGRKEGSNAAAKQSREAQWRAREVGQQLGLVITFVCNSSSRGTQRFRPPCHLHSCASPQPPMKQKIRTLFSYRESQWKSPVCREYSSWARVMGPGDRRPQCAPCRAGNAWPSCPHTSEV